MVGSAGQVQAGPQGAGAAHACATPKGGDRRAIGGAGGGRRRHSCRRALQLSAAHPGLGRVPGATTGGREGPGSAHLPLSRGATACPRASGRLHGPQPSSGSRPKLQKSLGRSGSALGGVGEQPLSLERAPSPAAGRAAAHAAAWLSEITPRELGAAFEPRASALKLALCPALCWPGCSSGSGFESGAQCRAANKRHERPWRSYQHSRHPSHAAPLSAASLSPRAIRHSCSLHSCRSFLTCHTPAATAPSQRCRQACRAAATAALRASSGSRASAAAAAASGTTDASRASPSPASSAELCRSASASARAAAEMRSAAARIARCSGGGPGSASSCDGARSSACSRLAARCDEGARAAGARIATAAADAGWWVGAAGGAGQATSASDSSALSPSDPSLQRSLACTTPVAGGACAAADAVAGIGAGAAVASSAACRCLNSCICRW